ncbi:MAG: hypothetical protein ABSC06_28090 [Rhodopila sp.]|jgi:hypothetical protein
MSAFSLPSVEAVTSSPGAIALNEPRDGTVTLRISGGKPLRVRAELLAECSSWSAGAPAWHELVLYRCHAAGFAVGVKTCRASADGSDVFHARIFPELDPALAWLQAFNPTADLGADIDASDRRISTTEIALRAATLRQHTDRVEQQYRVMIGELLYRMDIGE